MKIAFIADIHGNADALEAVLGQLDSQPPARVYCLGDMVGYGAEPTRCVEMIRERAIPALAGNHEWAVIGRIDMDCFNPEARRSAEWTREALSDDERTYLASLPLLLVDSDISMVHGSLWEPHKFNYVLSMESAVSCLEAARTPRTFMAHSHVPLSFLLDGNQLTATVAHDFRVAEGHLALVNVGSVGQPRDTDPRAAYALFDTETGDVSIRRVEYDAERAAGKILAAGLPPSNAYRLLAGQ